MFGRGERDDLQRLLDEQRRASDELERARLADSRREPITGLLAWRAFRTLLGEEVRRAREQRAPLALALVELGDLHPLAAHHGHAAVDELLSAVGRLIADQTRSRAGRPADLVTHLGGGEFGALFPATGGEGALACAQRILRELEELDGVAITTATATIGVAELAAGQSAEQLIGAAAGARSAALALGGGRALLHGAESDGEAGAAETDAANALVGALLARDQYTGEHSESVVEMSAAVASQLGMSAQEIEWVRSAALLHDIGKVGIPDSILNKPGPLDEHEWRIMREHPAIGERILRAVPGMGPIARIVRHEHERWDGGGYPDQLAGEEIPLGARIILVCDGYHAMTSDRPYRASIGHEAAVEELRRCAGTQFDPRVVGALIGYLYAKGQAGVPAAAAH